MCPEERTGNAGFWTESDAPYAYAKRSEAWGDESKMAETDPAAPPAAPCWAVRFPAAVLIFWLRTPLITCTSFGCK